MSVDPTSLFIGVAAGGAAGLGVSLLSFYPRRGNRKVQVVQRQEDGRLRKRTVTTEELEKSRREMRTVILERDLLSSALTKVYEAENEGKITREEREMIARRYSLQIRDLETRLRDKELVVEVGELEKLRDELLTLFREKVQNIETRLDQAKERLPSASEQDSNKGVEPEIGAGRVARTTNPAIVTVATQSGQTDDLERVVERKAPKRDDTEGERRVRAIRDEVMDALERLEQIDNRKENEATS
jgi:hypothetical protein